MSMIKLILAYVAHEKHIGRATPFAIFPGVSQILVQHLDKYRHEHHDCRNLAECPSLAAVGWPRSAANCSCLLLSSINTQNSGTLHRIIATKIMASIRFSSVKKLNAYLNVLIVTLSEP